MDRNRSARRTSMSTLLLTLAVGFAAAGVHAQTGPLPRKAQAPQARSQDEMDAYLQVADAADPREAVRLAEVFATRYPASELLGLVYQSQMHAYESLGDFRAMLRTGKEALVAQPDNLNTLLALAPAMANHAEGSSDRAELLDGAADYARRALTGVAKTRPPHEISIERWSVERRDIEKRAHEVLGVVALARRQSVAAIDEFEAVIRLAPSADGAEFFRLGAAYSIAGRREEAEQAFRRAAELGPEDVRTLARKELGKVSAPAAPQKLP